MSGTLTLGNLAILQQAIDLHAQVGPFTANQFAEYSGKIEQNARTAINQLVIAGALVRSTGRPFEYAPAFDGTAIDFAQYLLRNAQTKDEKKN